MTPEIEFLIGMLPPFAVAICLYVLIYDNTIVTKCFKTVF